MVTEHEGRWKGRPETPFRPPGSTPRKVILYIRPSANPSPRAAPEEPDLEKCLQFLKRLGFESASREILREEAELGQSRTAKALLRRAKSGDLRCVIVARLDDLAPRSVLALMSLILKLERLGVPVYPVDEYPWFGPPSGQRSAIIRAFEWAVGEHLKVTSERVRTTIARRKSEAEKAGRPFHWGRSAQSLAVTRPELREQVAELRKARTSWSTIAEKLGITVSSARRLHESSECNDESPSQ